MASINIGRIVLQMEGNESISERLLQYIQHLGLNLSSFAYSCGVQEKLLLNLKEGYSSAFRKISKAYPQLNIQWLMYGEGDMVYKPTSKHRRIRTPKNRIKREARPDLTIYKEPYPIRDRLYIFIKHLGISSYQFMESLNLSVSGIILDTIDKSEFAPVICGIICEKYPELNYNWLLRGKGNMLNSLGGNYTIASQKSLSKKMSVKNNYVIGMKGIIPPIPDKPCGGGEQLSKPKAATIPIESIKQEEGAPEDNIIANNNHLCLETDEQPPVINKIETKGFIPWRKILKMIVVGIGAITGIFLVVWVIAEFVLPAIFVGLLFLSMLFAKK